jgi:hypothetical protein
LNQVRNTAFSSGRSINRYYDPSTDQFLSVDPDVQATDQPYVFTNDDPLNATDPLGQDAFPNEYQPCVNDCWSGKDWIILGGLALGVLGAATGVGAVVELAAGVTDAAFTLGATSVVAGIASTAIDGSQCSTSRVACAGAALGAVDIITGSGGLASGASIIGLSLTAFSANVGVAASVYDVTAVIATGTTHTPRTETVQVKVLKKDPVVHHR